MKNIILYIIILISFSSCDVINVKIKTLKKSEVFTYFSKKRERKEIAKLVTEWQGREIKFPNDLTFTLFGKDTIEYNYNTSEYKIFMYVDSASCLKCSLQLLKWSEFIEEVDSIYGEKVSFLFAFNSKTIKELYKITKKDGFNYPVIADIDDDFNRINQFPTNDKFHVFLLDKENKVSVIGNPVYNPSVKDLYLKMITNKDEEQKDRFTVLKNSVSDIDLGNISHGEIIEKEVQIHNIGEYDFILKDIVSSCDCTEGISKWDDIKSGDKNSLTIRFKAEEKGEFLRTVSIYGNMEDEFLEITISGIVI